MFFSCGFVIGRNGIVVFGEEEHGEEEEYDMRNLEKMLSKLLCRLVFIQSLSLADNDTSLWERKVNE